MNGRVPVQRSRACSAQNASRSAAARVVELRGRDRPAAANSADGANRRVSLRRWSIWLLMRRAPLRLIGWAGIPASLSRNVPAARRRVTTSESEVVGAIVGTRPIYRRAIASRLFGAVHEVAYARHRPNIRFWHCGTRITPRSAVSRVAASHSPHGMPPSFVSCSSPGGAAAPSARPPDARDRRVRAAPRALASAHARAVRRPAAPCRRVARPAARSRDGRSAALARRRATARDDDPARGHAPRSLAALAPARGLPRRSRRHRPVRQRRGRALRRPRRRRRSRSRGWRAAEEEVRELAVALIGLGGRHIDDATPCVDVRLDGGIRVHAVLPPVAAEGTAISIRVPRLGPRLARTLEAARHVRRPHARRGSSDAVRRRENLLVTGAAGAGKTTLLAALLAAAPAGERIVTIEDVAELRIDHPHHVRLEARQPNLEGAGGDRPRAAGARGAAHAARPARRRRVPRRRGARAAHRAQHRPRRRCRHPAREQPRRRARAARGARRARRARRSAPSRVRSVSAIGLVLHVERGAGRHPPARRRRAAGARRGRAARDRGGRMATTT